MEENNVFTGKSVDAAIEEGLTTLGISREEAEITVLDEGKKKLFGAVKARVKVEKKCSEAKRASDFIDGLLEILKISAVSEILSEGENIVIDIKATNSAQIIGKRGEVLDAIQNLAGAVANIGRDEYKKVIVDCENYRAQREETLKKLADKIAKRAVEKGRKIILEPMNPYERRIIHSALSDNTEVTTISEGKEPNRYIAVIPNNAKPNDRGIKYGENRNRKDFRRAGGFGKPRTGENGKPRGERNFSRDRRDNRGGIPNGRSGGGAKRGKKEIYFGSYLGNSGAKPEPDNGENKE